MKTAAFKDMSVIICASDETASLVQTVETLLSVCQREDIRDINILYPDFVTAECLETIRSLTEGDFIKATRQKEKGVGSAIREGIEAAEASHILMMDADLSHDVKLVSLLVEQAKKNPEKICKLSRYMPGGGFDGYNKVQHFFNALAQILLHFLFGNKLTDMTDAFQLVPSGFYKNTAWRETGFPFFLELVLRPLVSGAEYVEIPAVCRGRTQGKSKNAAFQKLGYLRVAVGLKLFG